MCDTFASPGRSVSGGEEGEKEQESGTRNFGALLLLIVLSTVLRSLFNACIYRGDPKRMSLQQAVVIFAGLKEKKVPESL